MRKLASLALLGILCLVPSLNAGAAVRSSATPPVTISVFAIVDPSYQPTNINTNWFTKYAEQKFNIKLVWNVVAPADGPTKQQLLLGSGDYPAVIYNGSFKPVQLLKFGQQGILIPLNKYLPQYAPNVLKAFKEFTGAKESVTAPDGNVYGIPFLNYCLHCFYSAKLWINTKWLAQVHMSMPKTTAEFAQVLQAFKTIPGVKKPIPLSGATDGWHSDPTAALMNAFLFTDGDIGTASPATHVFFQKGKLMYAPVQPQWQQGLTYIRSLVTSGVLDSSAFSQPNLQLRAETAQNRVGAFAWGVDNGVASYATGTGTAQAKSSDWVVVPPLTGPTGANYAAFFGAGPNPVPFAITNKATPAQIKAILTMVNWIYTIEGTTTMDFGPKGKMWDFAKPGQRGLCSKQAILNINWNMSTSLVGWGQLGPGYQSQAWRCGGPYTPIFSAASEEEKYQAMTSQYYEGHQPKYTYAPNVWLPASQLTPFATSQTNINTYVTQWTYDFILGRKNITKDWNTYLSGLNGLGLTQYLQTLQSANPKPVDTSAFCPETPATLPCHQSN